MLPNVGHVWAEYFIKFWDVWQNGQTRRNRQTWLSSVYTFGKKKLLQVRLICSQDKSNGPYSARTMRMKSSSIDPAKHWPAWHRSNICRNDATTPLIVLQRIEIVVVLTSLCTKNSRNTYCKGNDGWVYNITFETFKYEYIIPRHLCVFFPSYTQSRTSVTLHLREFESYRTLWFSKIFSNYEPRETPKYVHQHRYENGKYDNKRQLQIIFSLSFLPPYP